MCQTVEVNRKWRNASIATGGVLAVATTAIVAGTTGVNSPAPSITLDVLWGGWLAFNVLWAALASLHLISLPDVCPCSPPHTLTATAARQLWWPMLLSAGGVGCYALVRMVTSFN